jgi:ABC-type sugar transport system substrate-binding protein
VKYIIEVFSVMLVLVFNLLLCVSMLGVSADVAAAKEFKAAMIAEIENSDFNPYVIDGCKAQAGTEGYELEVQSYTYGGQSDRRIAGINLYYRYRIPLLGVSQQRVTRGIAR